MKLATRIIYYDYKYILLYINNPHEYLYALPTYQCLLLKNDLFTYGKYILITCITYLVQDIITSYFENSRNIVDNLC